MKRNQALSYTTIAMKKLGYDQKEIENITNEMLSTIEQYNEEEAEFRADEILYGDR